MGLGKALKILAASPLTFACKRSTVLHTPVLTTLGGSDVAVSEHNRAREDSGCRSRTEGFGTSPFCLALGTGCSIGSVRRGNTYVDVLLPHRVQECVISNERKSTHNV